MHVSMSNKGELKLYVKIREMRKRGKGKTNWNLLSVI